jgi:xanthine dehydrogenase accessory factor
LKDLFKTMYERLTQKEPLVLATLIAGSGSTPRDAGARMLIGGSGRIWGSVGGALAEHLVIEEAAALIAKRGGSSLGTYILHENETADIDAKCGGEFTVFSQYLNADIPGLLDFVKEGITRFSEKEGTWFIMDVSGSPASVSLLLAAKDRVIAALGTIPADVKSMPQVMCKRSCVLLERNGLRWFSEPLTAAGFVYVFGGGHVAQELVPLLDRLGFRCIVFDDREEFTGPELFPCAVGIIRGEFEVIGKHINLDENDYVVILTRGHRWDYEAEAFALHSRAAYIGVIGSKAKHAFVQGRLKEAGFTESEIHAPRVHAPIGIDIGSKTPAEIAVSIGAELIKVRAAAA